MSRQILWRAGSMRELKNDDDNLGKRELNFVKPQHCNVECGVVRKTAVHNFGVFVIRVHSPSLTATILVVYTAPKFRYT